MRLRRLAHVVVNAATTQAIMFEKVLVLCCACLVARAVPIGPVVYGGYGLSHGYAPAIAAPIAHTYAAPSIVKAVAAPVIHAEPVDPNPAYSFSYGVADPATGDHKDAAETLQNGVVHGSYSLVEPDGHIRKVTYTADKINGFNAVVERTGGAHPASLVAAAPAPVAVAAPIAKLTLPAIGHYG